MMTKFYKVLVFFLLLPLSNIAQKIDTLTIKGVYYGKNLIVVNPSKNGIFCIKKIILNGAETDDEIRSAAFEIDFQQKNLSVNMPINIIFVYDSALGTPEIYNQQDIIAASSVHFKNSGIDKKMLKIFWEVEGEDLKNDYEIEQFRWDKWVSIVTVSPDTVQTFPKFSILPDVHSGKNLFRIKYTDSQGTVSYSELIKYTSKTPEVLLLTEKVKTTLEFSELTLFEIIDANGNIVLNGKLKVVDVSNLDKGRYYVNFDNKTAQFTKK